jgi:hypothetical protein
LLAEQEARIADKTSRNKTDVIDQAACLVFKKGTTKKDPPDAKTKNISKMNSSANIQVQFLPRTNGLWQSL